MRKICGHVWALLHWYKGHDTLISAIPALQHESKKTGKMIIISLHIRYYEIFFLILGMRSTTLFSTFLNRPSFLIHSRFLREPICWTNKNTLKMETTWILKPTHRPTLLGWRKYLILSLKKLEHPETCFCYDLCCSMSGGKGGN